jgi:hypothetical protein
MGFHSQEVCLPVPFARARMYNGNKYVTLRGRVWFATSRGEDVDLSLARPLDHTALVELGLFMRMWQNNDYVHIHFHLDYRIDGPELRSVLVKLGVRIMPMEIESVGLIGGWG